MTLQHNGGRRSVKVEKVTAAYIELQDDTCHLTQVNVPQPGQASWYSIYLPWRDGRLSQPRLLATY